MKLRNELLYYLLVAPLSWSIFAICVVLWFLLVMPFVVIERAWRDSFR